MFNDEDALKTDFERVQFHLDENPKTAPATKKADGRCIAIVMTFHDPVPLGKWGLTEGVLVADHNGQVKAWII